MWAYAQLWYLLVTLLAYIFYTDPAIAQPAVLCRPSWAPVWLLQRVWGLNRIFLVCMVVFGLLLATDLVQMLWLRMGYVLFVFLVDFGTFAAYGGHSSFIFIYTSLAMVFPPGPQQSGILRLIMAHQLGSPGINKLRIGGLEYLKPSTLEYHLRFSRDRESCRPHALIEPIWVRQRWMIDLCLQNMWLMRILNWSGPALQISIAAVCLLGSGEVLYFAFAAACAFHLLSIPLLGIFFPFSIPCYMMALLPLSSQNANCLLSYPALIAGVLLFGSTLLLMEDWPLNGLALYPYNARQISILESLFGRYMLAHSSGKLRESDICLTQQCVSACPALCFPGHFKALQGVLKASANTKPLMDVAPQLADWLRFSRRFVDHREDGQSGRCFDDVVTTGPWSRWAVKMGYQFDLIWFHALGPLVQNDKPVKLYHTLNHPFRWWRETALQK